jgi:hypothetical protein
VKRQAVVLTETQFNLLIQYVCHTCARAYRRHLDKYCPGNFFFQKSGSGRFGALRAED